MQVTHVVPVGHARPRRRAPRPGGDRRSGDGRPARPPPGRVAPHLWRGPGSVALSYRFLWHLKRRRPEPVTDASTAAGQGEHEQDQYLTSYRPEME